VVLLNNDVFVADGWLLGMIVTHRDSAWGCWA
jgi:hypothetical protein